MGNLYTYFTASTDETAASAAVIPGGPESRERLGWPTFDTLEIKGIDPVVQLATLEGVMNGRSFDELMEDERCGTTVAEGEGDVIVVTITDTLRDALAQADEEQLEQAAGPWVQTEEFYGSVDALDLMPFLSDLSELASRAQTKGHRLYCWLST